VTEVTRGDRAALGAFAALCLCWGSTFAPLKVVASAVPPLLAAGVRFVIAGAILLVWTLARHGRVRLPAGDAVRMVAPAALAIAANYGLMAWGLRQTPSGVGAVVNLAVVPLSVWTCGVALRQEAFTVGTLGGLALGLSGLALLVARPVSSGEAGGMLAIALGSVCYGVGTVLSAPIARRRPAIDVSAVQMVVGGLILLAIARLIEHVNAAALGTLVQPDIAAAMGYLVAVGSLSGFTLYQYLLRRWPASRVAAYTFVSPTVALAIGVAFAGERITARALVASALLLVGMLLTTRHDDSPNANRGIQ